MKKFMMVSLLLICCSAIAQEKEKLRYRSFGISLIEGYGSNSSSNGGLSLTGDLSYEYKKHIFTLSAGVGSEFEITVFGDGNPDSFDQVNVLYGLEFNRDKWFSMEAHAGLGYFAFKSVDIVTSSPGYERKSTIGFPLMLKFKFRTGKRFCLGLRMQQNFNSANSITAMGILLQWNRYKK